MKKLKFSYRLQIFLQYGYILTVIWEFDMKWWNRLDLKKGRILQLQVEGGMKFEIDEDWMIKYLSYSSLLVDLARYILEFGAPVYINLKTENGCCGDKYRIWIKGAWIIMTDDRIIWLNKGWYWINKTISNTSYRVIYSIPPRSKRTDLVSFHRKLTSAALSFLTLTIFTKTKPNDFTLFNWPNFPE